MVSGEGQGSRPPANKELIKHQTRQPGFAGFGSDQQERSGLFAVVNFFFSSHFRGSMGETTSSSPPDGHIIVQACNLQLRCRSARQALGLSQSKGWSGDDRLSDMRDSVRKQSN